MPDERPTMRERFRHHHRYLETELADIWKSCHFLLDTNVLLNIYRYADATRRDFFKALEAVKDRIWIPNQVAEEFYANRTDVIVKQKAQFDLAIGSITKVISSLNSGDFTKSWFLDRASIEATLQPAIKQAIQLLQAQKEAHPDLLRNDPFLEELAQLISRSIGDPPPKDSLDKLYAKAEERIKENRPPGTATEDLKKPIPEKYGDILIWMEAIVYARSRKVPIIFVTDEKKDDWWQEIRGQKLGPRLELRAEMYKEAGIDFYMCSSSHFLEKISTQFVELDIQNKTIEEARHVEEQQTEEAADRITSEDQVVDIVADWIKRTFRVTPMPDVDGFDLWCDVDGHQSYIDVKYFRRSMAKKVIRDAITRTSFTAGLKPDGTFVTMFVCGSKGLLDPATNIVQELIPEMMGNQEVFVTEIEGNELQVVFQISGSESNFNEPSPDGVSAPTTPASQDQEPPPPTSP